MEPTNELASVYGDSLHFVLVYVVEPHPKPPDVSPYRGSAWPLDYSNYPQPTNYPGRVSNAKHINDAFALNSTFTILLDDLTPHVAALGNGNNPVWCTWGPAPNAAWLIGTDGNVELAQTWFDKPAMDAAIKKLLGSVVEAEDKEDEGGMKLEIGGEEEKEAEL